MTIAEILNQEQQIWNHQKLSLSQIIIRMGKVFGDICKYERNEKPSDRLNDTEIKKEMGNMITSTIRWCDDLGYDPQDCINLALKAQKKYAQEIKK